jgi:hypothetical protein
MNAALRAAVRDYRTMVLAERCYNPNIIIGTGAGGGELPDQPQIVSSG